MSAKHFLPLVLTVAFCLAAHGTETVKIMFGGPGTAKALEQKKTEVEKVIGATLEVKVSAPDKSLVALDRGFIDMVALASTAQEAATAQEKLGMKMDLSQYQSFVYLRVPVQVAVHPSNPVESLTEQQTSDIFSGKIKNWKPITGKDLPITVVLGQNYSNLILKFMNHYINSPTSPVAQLVVDKDGLIKRIKQDPGAIGLLPSKESVSDFTPKYFNAGFDLQTHIISKKKLSPAAQKLYDYLKANVSNGSK
jgi:hypothetical protein